MGNICKGNANNVGADAKQQNKGNNENVRQKNTSPTINENHELFKETVHMEKKTKSAVKPRKTIPTPFEILSKKELSTDGNINEPRINTYKEAPISVEWGYFNKEDAANALIESWSCNKIGKTWKDAFPKEDIGNFNVSWLPAQDLVKDCNVLAYLQEPVRLFHPIEHGAIRLDNKAVRRTVFPTLYKVLDLILASSLKDALLHQCFVKLEKILLQEEESIHNEEKFLIPSFCVRLYRNYVPEYFIVDKYVPVFGEADNNNNGGCLEHEYWPLIIEKALAKQNTSYDNITRLEFHDLFHSLTGGNLQYLKLDTGTINTREDDDKKKDDMTSETLWHLLLSHHADGDIIGVEWNVNDNNGMDNNKILTICTGFFRNREYINFNTDEKDGKLNDTYDIEKGYTLDEIQQFCGRFVEINDKYYSWDKKICFYKFFMCLLPHDEKPIRELNYFPNTITSIKIEEKDEEW